MGKKQRFYLRDTVKMMSRLQIVIEIMALLFEVKNCITIEQVSWSNLRVAQKYRTCCKIEALSNFPLLAKNRKLLSACIASPLLRDRRSLIFSHLLRQGQIESWKQKTWQTTTPDNLVCMSQKSGRYPFIVTFKLNKNIWYTDKFYYKIKQSSWFLFN